jgi:hypothetical protein
VRIDGIGVYDWLAALVYHCMSPIKLLWFGDGGYPWGRNWLLELLPPNSVEIHTYKPGEVPEIEETCLICTNAGAGNAYIAELRSHGCRFGVILMSDECLTEKLDYMEDPNCVFLARNYVHPGLLANPKTFVFGLGWQNGYETHANAHIRATDRKYVWGFAGSLKTDREKALKALEAFEPHRTHIFKEFNDPEYLAPKEYAEVLNDCMFVPAPCGGASNDSFRIYEALEAGAIPVVLKNAEPLIIEPSYWHAVFRMEPTLPFVVADSWEEAALKMLAVIQSGQINQVQESCISFWLHWKEAWKKMFALGLDMLTTNTEPNTSSSA